jgi:signal transduction histidine kinase
MKLAATSPSPQVLDATLHSRNGSKLQLSVTVGSVEDPGAGLILIARDITAQRKVEAHLQQQEKLSRIGEIVASVAHELNNPLSGVVGFSGLLMQRSVTPEVRRDVERILDCAGRCQKIVLNLLSFARPSRAERQPLGLNGVLEKTLDLLEPSFDGERVRVIKELEPNLPYVEADFHQIQQVLTNLISNAHQAICESGRGNEIVIRSFRQGGRIVLSVSDNGPGIPGNVLPHIFDPFFTTKEQGKGTGLGLSISYGIVREHGGELLVDTEVGSGTTFSAAFPVCVTEDASSDTGSAEAVPDGSCRRILAVDDEPVIVDLYLEILRSLGYAVDTAATGVEALRKIRESDYDLVVSDIKMPKMNGVELYEKVRELKPDMADRFIFITGDVNFLSDRQHSTIKGLPCLLKPVNVDIIESTIREVLPV